MVKDLTLNELKEVLDNNNKVFIDFYADWCGPCRAMGPVVEELSEEVNDVAFYKVNCDDEEELAVQFQVTNIPCFFIIKDGKIASKVVGMREKEDLKKLL